MQPAQEIMLQISQRRRPTQSIQRVTNYSLHSLKAILAELLYILQPPLKKNAVHHADRLHRSHQHVVRFFCHRAQLSVTPIHLSRSSSSPFTSTIAAGVVSPSGTTWKFQFEGPFPCEEPDTSAFYPPGSHVSFQRNSMTFFETTHVHV